MSNLLIDTYPELIKEFDNNLNEIDINSITYNSHKKIYWKCDHGHSWQTIVYNRTKNKTGCPVCNNNSFNKEYRRKFISETFLINEWDYEKNLKEFNLKPSTTTSMSEKKVYWKCNNNHSWLAAIHNRIRGHGCPYCSGRLPIKGENDFQTLFPELCKEGNELGWWDYEKNLQEFNLTPDQIKSNSGKKVYWKCKRNHSWQAVVYSRTKENIGCPYCSNKKVLKGFNDLLTVNPELCDKNNSICWDYELNFIKPDEITSRSPKRVYWKCNKNHSWKTTIWNITVKRTTCPECTKYRRTSFGEQCIYYYLLPYNAKNRFKVDNMEIDIYLPNKSDKTMPVGIEFNGLYWHKDKTEKDLIKELKLSHKVKMYYICESDKNEINKNKIYFDCARNKIINLEWALNKLFKILNLDIDVNIKRDELLIRKLLNKEPVNINNLLQNWDFELNTLNPNEITSKDIKVYWKCNKNHSFLRTIKLYQKSQKCPYCTNKKVLKGFNDLQTLYPDIAKEWDYEKNFSEYGLKPDEITPGSHKKIWWKCKFGHSWQTIMYDRLNRLSCPICKKNK